MSKPDIEHPTRAGQQEPHHRRPAGFRPAPPPKETAAGPTCPVLALGTRLGRTVEAYWRMDEEKLAAAQAHQHSDLIQAQDRHRLLGDSLDQIEETISFTRAESLEGALVQVMTAWGTAESFDVHALTEDQTEAAAAKLKRLLYSIRRALMDAIGTEGIEPVSEFYMRREYDPFLVLDAVEAA